MALNPFFLQGSTTEQNLVQDLINEQIKMYGVDVHYIPRQYVVEKTILKEVSTSEFKYAFPIEAYVETYDGHQNLGTLLSKFGIQELDDLTITISQERFETYLKPLLKNLPNIKLPDRPKEGDLIYFPLGDRLFEIKYIEHESPFYQLKKNYTYQLKCELFRYGDEIIDTDYDYINDNVQDQGYTQTFTLIGPALPAFATAGLVYGGIRKIRLDNRGSGYTHPPSVAISSSRYPDGTAVGFATMIDGITDFCNSDPSLQRIQGVELSNAGYGYTVPPLVKFIGGNGTKAKATAILGNGIVGIITVTDGGNGYADPPEVIISDPGIGSATANITANINNSGIVTSIQINNQSGFWDNSSIIQIGTPSIRPAIISPQIDFDGTMLDPITITNPGAGYTTGVTNTIKFLYTGFTSTQKRFGTSSGHLNGSVADLISKNVGSNIFRDGRVDFHLKLGLVPNPGDLIISNGPSNEILWKLRLNSNNKLEFSITGEIFEVPVTVYDNNWHFVSIQRPVNPYGGFNTLIVVDGNEYLLTASDPYLYNVTGGIRIKFSNNTDCFIDDFRIYNSLLDYDTSIPSTEFTFDINTFFLYKFEQASASPNITDGKVSSITLLHPGSGYSQIPQSVVSDPTVQTSATILANVTNSGIITSFNIVNPGFGYTQAQTISIGSTNTQKIRALARSHINSSGVVTSITILDGGLGYSQSPIVTISTPQQDGSGDFILNENVVGSISSVRGVVNSWNPDNRTITLKNINGEFLTREYLVGQESGASYKIKIINTDNLTDPYSQNTEIQEEASEIIDFSEKNPFGTV